MTDTRWFIRLGSDEVGPLSYHELSLLARQGSVSQATPVSTDRSHWTIAATVEGLVFQPKPTANKFPSPAGRWLGAGSSQARSLIGDLREINFWHEAVPLDSETLKSLSKSFVFWAALFLGVVPLLIGTLSDIRLQLTAFAIFFAVLWGAVFKLFIVRDRGGWSLPIVALVFSGVVGINVLVFLYRHIFPQTVLSLSASENQLVSLFANICQVAVCEELCKIVPIVGYVLWKRSMAQPVTVVLMGVFSGLGFAAFENLSYGDLMVRRSYDLATSHGAAGLEWGVQAAVVIALLRSLSTVFCHAVMSGIFAYFVAVANFTKRRRGALVLIGLSITAIIHGVYDWLIILQPTFAAAVIAAAFVFFCGYLERLNELTGHQGS